MKHCNSIIPSLRHIPKQSIEVIIATHALAQILCLKAVYSYIRVPNCYWCARKPKLLQKYLYHCSAYQNIQVYFYIWQIEMCNNNINDIAYINLIASQLNANYAYLVYKMINGRLLKCVASHELCQITQKTQSNAWSLIFDNRVSAIQKYRRNPISEIP